MKDWLKSLLTSCSKVSSKRVIAIFVVINLIVLSYVATFTYYVCPIAMFDTLALLTGGMFGGTALTLGLPLLDCFLDTNGEALADGSPLHVNFVSWGEKES